MAPCVLIGERAGERLKECLSTMNASRYCAGLDVANDRRCGNGREETRNASCVIFRLTSRLPVSRTIAEQTR